MELINTLTEKLGISTDQAQSGIGMILKMLKGQLGEETFAKIAGVVPNADEYVASAEDAESQGSGGMLGALGGVAQAFGADKVGGLAGLAAGFSKLGLGQEQIQQFANTFFEFLGSQDGDAKAAAEEALGG